MEKVRVEEWKKKFMGEVTHELHEIRQAQEETMETQRQTFPFKLEKVIKELKRVKKLAQKRNYAWKKPEAKELAMTKSGRLEEIVEMRDSQCTKSLQVDMDTTSTPSSFDTNARICQSIKMHKVNSSPPNVMG